VHGGVRLVDAAAVGRLHDQVVRRALFPVQRPLGDQVHAPVVRLVGDVAGDDVLGRLERERPVVVSVHDRVPYGQSGHAFAECVQHRHAVDPRPRRLVLRHLTVRVGRVAGEPQHLALLQHEQLHVVRERGVRRLLQHHQVDGPLDQQPQVGGGHQQPVLEHGEELREPGLQQPEVRVLVVAGELLDAVSRVHVAGQYRYVVVHVRRQRCTAVAASGARRAAHGGQGHRGHGGRQQRRRPRGGRRLHRGSAPRPPRVRLSVRGHCLFLGVLSSSVYID